MAAKTRVLDAATIDPRFFLSCLQEAITDTVYNGINFKPKQLVCMERIFLRQDTLAVLPTGYGKSVTFHLLPKLLRSRDSALESSTSVSLPVVVVISPLNSLMQDQIQILRRSGIEAAIVNIRKEDAEDGEDVLYTTVTDAEARTLKSGGYSLLFCHPEAILSAKDGSAMFQSKAFTSRVQVMVVDEAHCILEW